MSSGNEVGDEGEQAPPELDTSVPHSARMYDWWIGGKDNFAADRELGERFAQAIPSIPAMARENRNFMHRVVRYLAGQAGIRQFLDIGTGIPTSPNVHEIAQGIAADSRVVYVDNDPLVLTHARALMVSDPAGRTAYIDADFTQPHKILRNPQLRAVLDLDQPVGLLMIAVLMLARDSDDPWTAVRTLMDELPSGSYLAITHPGQDFDPAAMEAVVRAATASGMTLAPRQRADVRRFFADWELVDPGVVPVMTWYPDGPSPADPHAAYYWAGLARKP
ncbi:SAM-dependent methyltransferase [Actinoplanes sp. NEAU-A12]|uniref:SAM-dependent methyltransferase n=1 Tax=Actinoplanes sandaracinus TaxID=3045177 RepID=A0ABT6WF50_9ACTN|nr:SAM-dependent methyltransferase [Actinoplanes sandaracinus]MDI6098346.1 SAM-dependent methyltransferase [Actinoplanes sandaracinus]